MVQSAQLRLQIQLALLCLVSLAGIAYGGDQFLRELHLQEGPGFGPVLAMLKEAGGLVQRKRASHYSWREAGVGAGFYRRESLQTGADSRALLALENAGRPGQVEVEENSLVVFDPNSEYGLEVLDGGITYRTKNFERRIEVQNGEELVRELSVSLDAPRMGEELFVSPNSRKTVQFRWHGKTSATTTGTLEVSPVASFRSATRVSVPLTEASGTALALGAGFYFWRVKDPKAVTSGTGTFRITEAAALTLKELRADAPGAVRVSWEAPLALTSHGTGRHFLEAAATADFREIVAAMPVDPGQLGATVSDLPVGKVYVRLVSRYGELQALSQTLAGFVAGTVENDDRAKKKAEDSRAGAEATAKRAESSGERNLASLGRESTSGSAPGSLQENSNATSTAADTLPAAVLQVNQQPTRVPLSISNQGNQVILSWIFPADPSLGPWAIWEADAMGNPLTPLQTDLDPTWRAVSLATDHLSEGELLMVVGQSASGPLPSAIVKFSGNAISISAPTNLQSTVVPPSSGSPFRKITPSWTAVGSPEFYLVQVFLGPSLWRTEEVPGTFTSVQYSTDDYFSAIQVCVMAVNGSLLSKPVSSCYPAHGNCNNACPAGSWAQP